MIAFSAMLAEWLGRNGFSFDDVANVLGCPVVTFRGWLAGAASRITSPGAPWSARCARGTTR